MNSPLLHRLLLAPPSVRGGFLPSRAFTTNLSRRYISAPAIAQTSFWTSLIPKPLRKNNRQGLKKKPKSSEWNPATFFIIIFLLIGSNSIQMIALKKDFAAFSRRADAKIGLLKEIIERIQNGEEVDVEGLLGTGDKEMEKEWEEVLQEIEKEDQAWELSQKPKPKHERNLQEEKNELTPTVSTVRKEESHSKSKTKSSGPPGFY